MTFVNAHIRGKAQLADGCYIESTKKKKKTAGANDFMTLYFDEAILNELGFADTDKVMVMPGQKGDFGSILLQPSTGRSGVKMRPCGERHFVVRVGARNLGWSGYELIQTRLPMHKVGKYPKGGIIFKIVGIRPENVPVAVNAPLSAETTQPDEIESP